MRTELGGGRSLIVAENTSKDDGDVDGDNFGNGSKGIVTLDVGDTQLSRSNK